MGANASPFSIASKGGWADQALLFFHQRCFRTCVTVWQTHSYSCSLRIMIAKSQTSHNARVFHAKNMRASENAHHLLQNRLWSNWVTCLETLQESEARIFVDFATEKKIIMVLDKPGNISWISLSKPSSDITSQTTCTLVREGPRLHCPHTWPIFFVRETVSQLSLLIIRHCTLRWPPFIDWISLSVKSVPITRFMHVFRIFAFKYRGLRKILDPFMLWVDKMVLGLAWFNHRYPGFAGKDNLKEFLEYLDKQQENFCRKRPWVSGFVLLFHSASCAFPSVCFRGSGPESLLRRMEKYT